MTFYEWLIKQKSRRDSIGDLAADVARDNDFPQAYVTLELLEWHLIFKLACDGAKEALRSAWKEYSIAEREPVGLKLRFEVLRRDNNTCQLCGARAPDYQIEIDHKVPVAKGGKSESSNLWALCFACNRGKGTDIF